MLGPLGAEVVQRGELSYWPGQASRAFSSKLEQLFRGCPAQAEGVSGAPHSTVRLSSPVFLKAPL